MIEESQVSLDTTTILCGSLQPQRGINPQASKYQLKLAAIFRWGKTFLACACVEGRQGRGRHPSNLLIHHLSK